MPPSALRERNAAREKSPGTFCQTSRGHPARTSLALGRLPPFRCARASPGRATSHRTGGLTAGRRQHERRWRYRSLRLCRTAGRFANSIRVRDRRGTVPCSVKTGCGRAREFLVRSFGAVDSQFLLAAVGTILGRADEHFDEVVVQRIVELALETPFKLGMIEVPWMEVEIIGMHGHGLIFELDDDL